MTLISYIQILTIPSAMQSTFVLLIMYAQIAFNYHRFPPHWIWKMIGLLQKYSTIQWIIYQMLFFVNTISIYFRIYSTEFKLRIKKYIGLKLHDPSNYPFHATYIENKWNELFTNIPANEYIIEFDIEFKFANSLILAINKDEPFIFVYLSFKPLYTHDKDRNRIMAICLIAHSFLLRFSLIIHIMLMISKQVGTINQNCESIRNRMHRCNKFRMVISSNLNNYQWQKKHIFQWL